MTKSEKLFNHMEELSLNAEFDEEPNYEENNNFLYKDWAKSGINQETIDYYVQMGFAKGTENDWKLNYPELISDIKTEYYEIRLKNPKPGQGKYLKPKGQVSRLFRPLDVEPNNVLDKHIRLMITEGSKKAIKATQEGFDCLSLSGVYNWKQNPDKVNTQNDKPEQDESTDRFIDIISDFKDYDFEDKTIILAYDADMWHNSKVKQALYQLAAFLISEKKAKVSILKLPDGDAKGIDDFLVKYGKEKFQELVDNAPEITLKDVQNELSDNKKLLTFPIEVFPKNIQNLIIDLHEKYDAPIEYIECVFLSVISMIICGHYSINVKPDSEWIEHAIFWIALIGNPSQKKTPCLKIGKDILDNYDRILEDSYLEDYKKYKESEDEYKQKVEDRKKKIKANQPAGEIPKEPELPHKARFTTQNVTVESLIDIIKANSRYNLGVGLYMDELTYLLNSFNQYKRNGNDKQFFLQSWSKMKQNIVRKSSKIDYLVDVGHNIIGGIQPKVLYKTLLKDGIESTDGMVERWLFCCSEYLEKGFSYPNVDPLDIDKTNSFKNLCNDIFGNISNNFEKLSEYAFDSEAQKLFIDYCNNIVENKKSNKMNDLVKSYLQKQTNYIARLSLVIQMFYDYKNTVIPAHIVQKAIKVSRYFISCFSYIINSKVDSNPIEDLAINYLKTKKLTEISPTKLFKSNETKYKNTDKAKRVLENLAQKGFGRMIKAKNGTKFVFYGC